jgi:hypothetical protein
MHVGFSLPNVNVMEICMVHIVSVPKNFQFDQQAEHIWLGKAFRPILIHWTKLLK